MHMDDDILEVPARIGAYRDAGYSPERARVMARQDFSLACEDYLEQERLDPVTNEFTSIGILPSDSEVEEAAHNHELAAETHALTNACKRHNIGMSDLNYRLLSRVQNSFHRQDLGRDLLPTMEAVHAEQISPMQLTIHMEEGTGFSLKEMWKKLRASMINTFNRIKSWYIKAFDATARLGKKATAVKNAIEGKNGAIQNASFSFNGVKHLSIGGRAPSPQDFVNAVKGIGGITENVLNKNTEYYNKLTEGLSKAMDELIKKVSSQVQKNPNDAGGDAAPKEADFTQENIDNTFLNDLKSNVNQIKNNISGKDGMVKWDDVSSDSRFKDVAASGKAEFFKSAEVLPGDKMVVISIPNMDGEVSAESLKEYRQAFGLTVEDVKDKPRELEDTADFKTLALAQIETICDVTIDACKAGLDYKLKFAARDKAFGNLGKELDKVVNQTEGLEGAKLTYVRANVSAATTIFNRINSGEARWFKYAMAVLTRSVDYAQASLNEIQ